MNKLKDGTTISKNDIEKLNALGPYSMAIWESGEVKLGNEEGLKGRSKYFLDLLRSEILKHFSLNQIKKMKILDVGCNDGWILHQLSDLPFKKLVGIEPRKKNIEKGKLARKILKLSNNVEYKQGYVESLKNEKFDIVVCAGLLYHVESIPAALKEIKKVCNNMLFIESRCLSSQHITKKLINEIEMRDIVYQYKDQICGVTAQKYESSYYDGSSRIPTIVNVPTTETLLMNLNILGFEKIKTVVDEKKYRADVWKDKRPLSGVCISAFLHETRTNSFLSQENKWISDYESGLKKTILKENLIENLYKKFCLNKKIIANETSLKEIIKYIKSGNVINFDKQLCVYNLKNKYLNEIIKNLVYSPIDKISLEYGKFLIYKKNIKEGIKVLEKITQKLNSDWRSVYRSFDLLHKAYKKIGNEKRAHYYLKLLIKSNSKYN